ncbi:class I SAM-dependent methyltransferase [Natranaeroarchaeum aerophilus]|uniref:Class I SAM-dependent methyltransferase n=1 Tax=Natranaeroarchaeum aerophilus TaxID=2917711 RepID=A0AAE3FNW6_9EURY|nr:class I SAM-dependent methyltransferase [Natranaeroarchaeum aerophilus]MCL9812544.1 class I SAM-dependent methyltransferase [Natranaeroarchaeum aerophilus]
MADPFGHAIHDHYHGTRSEPLVQRDGEQRLDHPIEAFYFEPYEAGDDPWLETWLDGPLLDMGAGAGRHVRYFQSRFETVGIEHSEPLVETMRDRGVEDARLADMFVLRDSFEADRFGSALAYGTQLGLARSMAGLRTFLADLAYVTTRDGTAVLDCYDPTQAATEELLGYRSDPTPGLAYRLFQFEYDGVLGRPLLFRLFSPDRVREATTGTGWTVVDVDHGDGDTAHYRIALEKRGSSD